jgi:hypothetical protein
MQIQINSNSENFTVAESSSLFNSPSKCTNLDFYKCLQTSHCGWLIDGMNLSKCLPGTPIGPLNPKLQPDAESSKYGNIQNDRWVYSHQNPFISFQ